MSTVTASLPIPVTVKELKNFIKNNSLDFPAGGRNTNIVVLCGYALYINASVEDCKDAISKKELTAEVAMEMERIYTFADRKDYGVWWDNESNRNTYKFS